jgi:hypothetical protein
MTIKKINEAILHLRLEIIANRGDGYAYFIDLKDGSQIGASVMVCFLNHLTLGEWHAEAQHANKSRT